MVLKQCRQYPNRLLDETYQTALTGPSRDYAESSSNIVFAFVLALILIYLVLSAQFESFLDPFTIMFTVPLALAGALLSLWIFGQTLNIFSEIGMIMLIGLVTKNGILIVEFANQRRAHGLKKMEAVVDAATQRLRPILMTSLATSFGALPIALSLGASSASRVPLGIVVVCGILFSLIFTLFVIPAVYTFISGKHKTEEELNREFTGEHAAILLKADKKFIMKRIFFILFIFLITPCRILSITHFAGCNKHCVKKKS